MEKIVKPAPFLKDIECIVFDMDGVITSEQNYWNAAALTIYEVLHGKNYHGEQEIKASLTPLEIREIRSQVFLQDKTIALLKDRGVNTNWDLAYVVICGARILSTTNYEEVYQYFLARELAGMEIYDFISDKLVALTGMDKSYFKRHGIFWEKCKRIFQEWYLGEQEYVKAYGHEPMQSGKKGLMYSEDPVIQLDKVKKVLKTLYDSGIQMGIGTGRPYTEIHTPLMQWDIAHYFDDDAYVTYTDVEKAEEQMADKVNIESLAKPHPYVFLKAIYKDKYSDEELLTNQYDKSRLAHTLIIGDAGSDIMAAKAIECPFAAVLTGVIGEKARAYFEDMGATYILNNISELII